MGTVAGTQYRVDGGTPVDIGTASPPYDVVGLSPGTHTFEVREYDDATPPNYAAWSNVASCDVPFDLDGFATTNARWFDLNYVRSDYTGPLARVDIGGTPTDLNTYAAVVAALPFEYDLLRVYAQDGSGDYLVPTGGTTPVLKASTIDGKPCWYGGVMGMSAFNNWNGRTHVNVVVASRAISQSPAGAVFSGGTAGLKQLQGQYGVWYLRENGTTGYVRYPNAYCRTTYGMVQRYHYDGSQVSDAAKLNIYYNHFSRSISDADAFGSGSVASSFTNATGLYIGGYDDGTQQRPAEYFGAYYFGYSLSVSEWVRIKNSIGNRLFGTTTGQLFPNGDSLTESYNLNGIDPTHTWPSQVITKLETITGRTWSRLADGVIAEVGAPLARIIQIAGANAPQVIDDWAQDSVAVLGGGSNDLADETLSAKTFTADNTTDIIACTAHGYRTGICVRVSNSGGGLPAGLAAATDYFVIEGADANHFLLAATVADSLAGTHINITSNGTGTQTVTPTPNPTAVLAKQKIQVQDWQDWGVQRVIIDSITPRTDLTGAAFQGSNGNAAFETARQTYLAAYQGYSWPTGTELIDFGSDPVIQDADDTTWYIDKVHGTLAFYTRKANLVTTKVLNDVIAPSAISSLVLTPITGGIDYAFTAATDNIAVQKYQYRVDSGSWTDAGSATSGSITGLTPGVSVTISIRAVDWGDNVGPVTSGTATPASASAIDPETISSFKAVLYAEDISQGDNTDLNLWNDRTASNNDMTGPPSGGASPKFRTTGGVGGSSALDKCITFNGASQWLDWANFSAFTEAEAFIVVKLTTDPPPSPNVALFDLGAVHTDFFPYDATDFYCDFFSTTRHHCSGGAWASRPDLDTQYRIINFKSKASLWEVRVDDTLMFTDATNTVAGQATTKFGVSGGNPLAGKVVGVFLSNAVLSSTDHDGVHLFIQTHFGL